MSNRLTYPKNATARRLSTTTNATTGQVEKSMTDVALNFICAVEALKAKDWETKQGYWAKASHRISWPTKGVADIRSGDTIEYRGRFYKLTDVAEDTERESAIEAYKTGVLLETKVSQ